MGGPTQQKIAKTIAGQTKNWYLRREMRRNPRHRRGEKGLIGEHITPCGIMITTVEIMAMVIHYIGM